MSETGDGQLDQGDQPGYMLLSGIAGAVSEDRWPETCPWKAASQRERFIWRTDK